MNEIDPGSRGWLNQLAFGLLLVLVFTVPFDDVAAVPGFGTLSRLVGYAGVGAAVGDILTKRHFRRPQGAMVWVILFAIWAGLSLAWTVSMGESMEKGAVMLRSLGMVWILYEYVDGDARWRALLTAFVLGCYVCVAGLLMALQTGPLSGDQEYARYAVGQMDPNDVAATLAVGVPMAWYLAVMTRSRVIRWLSRIYIPLAAVAILLTGSRGGLIALLVALGYVANSVKRVSIGMKVLTVVVVLMGLAAAYAIVPETGLGRFLTISDEVRGGTLSTRTMLWRSGFEYFPDHPFGGAGVGGFREEVFVRGGYFRRQVAHNVVLGILFDLGLVGLSLFALLIGSLLRWFRRLPLQERRVGEFILLTWFVASMMLSLEYRKMTWVLIGALAALTVRMAQGAWRADESKDVLRVPPMPAMEPGMNGMEG